MPVIHPLLLAVIPILHILASSTGEAGLGDAMLPMLISMGFALVAFVVLRLVLKNWEASGVIVSLFLVLFFSFGHFAGFIKASPVADYIVWLPVTGVILVAGIILVVKYRDSLGNLTRVLNVVAVALLVMTLVSVVINERGGEAPVKPDEVSKAADDTLREHAKASGLPDIYYIILDAYASEGALRDFYGYDNGGFTRWLEQRGFYVASDSHSNYSQTYLSLASSLNLKHVDYLAGELGERSTTRKPLRRMIEDNSLVRFLKSMGYSYAFFGSGWAGTLRNRHADLEQSDYTWLNNEFTTALLRTTALRDTVSSRVLFTREGVLSTFSRLPRVRDEVKGPLFVFAHIIPPHRPFIFDRNGESPKGGADINAWSSRDLYIEQLEFVNKKVKEMVDGILAASERPPVIILQADHGPLAEGTAAWLEDPGREDAELRMGILNAYYLPGGSDALYESITPVNSFRVVLNAVFGTGFSRLEDTSNFSSYKTPYLFKDVTEMLGVNSQGEKGAGAPATP